MDQVSAGRQGPGHLLRESGNEHFVSQSHRVRAAPAPHLRGSVTSYYGFAELATGPVRRREGPGREIVVIVSFGNEWSINGVRLNSFAAGLHEQQVTTEHAGESFGMQIGLEPPAAFALFGLPLHELAGRSVPLDQVLDDRTLVERLHDAADWAARFRLLDAVLTTSLAAVRPASSEVAWAWQRLVETHGRVRVGALGDELRWSRKRMAARFREQVGLTPKRAARLLRFERARALAERSARPDWTRIALAAGYYDQSHLINDFRAVTGRTPETFFQDLGGPSA
jgi:AraC-like DNA-binding protein